MMNIVSLRAAIAVSTVSCAAMLAGCMSSPTYGTGRSSNAQLTSDLSGMFSMKPSQTAVSDYKPRPELVRPASLTDLPAPQDSVASTNNPAWPESPEQRRLRIRTEATNNQDNNTADRTVINDLSVEPTKLSGLSPSEKQDEESRPMSNRESRSKRDEYNRRLAETKGGDSTTRKYLSEPPVAYRQPAETAAANDVGEAEAKKERRLKRESTKETGLRRFIPWL